MFQMELEESIQDGFCVFVASLHHFFNNSLLFWAGLVFSCPRSGISHFSKEPWFFLTDNGY